MRSVYILTCIILMMLQAAPGFADESALTLVKAIGDDRDDYIILGLGDALLTDNNDIYILNVKGNYIAHYDWDGNYKRRIGQRGKGPTDFYFPRSIACFEGKLYVLDKGNRRIAEIDLDTFKFNFYNDDEKNSFGSHLSILEDGLFMGIFSYIEDNRGRLGIVSNQGEVKQTFFRESPVDYKKMKNGPLEKLSMEDVARKVIGSSRLSPIYHLDKERKEVLISFHYPDNPLVFYLYSIEGKQLKKFSYALEEKKYKFSRFFLEGSLDKLRNPDKYPTRFEINLDSVSIYRDSYVAFLELSDYVKNKKEKNRRFCLVFDQSGRLKKKFEIRKDLRIFKQSNGYFLGMVEDEDIEKLYIYQLNLK